MSELRTLASQGRMMANEPEHREAEDTLPRDRVVPKLLMDYAEASWSMGVCERTLRNMVADGRLAVVKIGGRTLFAPADLRAVIQAHRTLRADGGEQDGPKSVQ